MRLAIDIDGVLCDHIVGLSAWAAHHKNLPFDKANVRSWDEAVGGTTVTRLVTEAYQDPAFLKGLPPVDGAREAVGALLEAGHTITAVSSRPQGTRAATEAWLIETFGRQIPVLLVKDKALSEFDVLVDDNADAALQFGRRGHTALLLAQPWNANASLPAPTVRKGYVRLAATWGAAVESLGAIAALRRRKEWEAQSVHFSGLVDVIYAVILAQGFTQLPDLPTLVVEHPYQVFALAVAYAAVVLSWIGYHFSLSAQPYRTWVRFAIDLALQPTYWVLVTRYPSPATALPGYFAVFCLYGIWGLVKGWEYDEFTFRNTRWSIDTVRAVIRLHYLAWILVVWALYNAMDGAPYVTSAQPGQLREWITTSLCLAIILAHRFQPIMTLLRRKGHSLAHDLDIRRVVESG